MKKPPLLSLKEPKFTELEQRIYSHEGIRQWVYNDSLGNATIGIGRCIAHGNEGVSVDESFYLLANDIASLQKTLSNFAWFKPLNSVRQGAILELAFNLGVSGLLRMTSVIDNLGDPEKAATALLNEKLWCSQVGINRSTDIANRLRTGTY